MKTKWFVVIAACMLAVSCAVNPVTGKKELSLISEKQEIAMGQQTDEEIRTQYGIYEDARLSAYVATAGQAIAKRTHRPNLVYHFAVLDTPVVNAFAAPGGYIYVTRGILALMNSEAEMAVVLGHELGHVNARHSVQKLSQMILVQAGLAIGSAVSKDFAKVAGIAGIGASLLFLKFSRDDEREADRLGVDYSRSTGYDPGRMVDFFASLERMGDLSGKNTLPGFLSTHPLTSERIKNVRAMLQDSDKKLIERGPEYARRIDGMIYGEDPRQGYVEGRAFYHPALRFACVFPEGWKVQNTPTQLTLVSADDKAAVVLQAEKSGESLSAYAKKKTASLEGGQFVNERNARINGLTCVHQVYDVSRAEQEKLRVQFSFIRKGEHVYTFSALGAETDFNRYRGQLSGIVDSFRELNDAGHLNRRPDRLRLVRADGTQSLARMFEKAGMKKESWPQVAVLNGLKPEAVPAAGRLVKIIQ